MQMDILSHAQHKKKIYAPKIVYDEYAICELFIEKSTENRPDIMESKQQQQ